jgi:hypothetical protein
MELENFDSKSFLLLPYKLAAAGFVNFFLNFLDFFSKFTLLRKLICHFINAGVNHKTSFCELDRFSVNTKIADNN